MFSEFKKRAIKELDIMDNNFKVPKKYWPEWYKKGLVPFEIEEERLEGEMVMSQPINKAKGISASIIENDDDIPKIKQAKEMQSPDETMWYDEMPAHLPPGKIIDNNDVVDNAKLQKYEVKMQEDNEIMDIRKRLLDEMQPKEEPKPKLAAPGEFVVWIRGHAGHIGDIKSTAEVCKKIIIEDDTLEADDLQVFMRVPLNKIVK